MPTIQLYLTNYGMIQAAGVIVNELQEIGLYQNDLALSKGFDPALLTEATFSNYARIAIPSFVWSAPAVIDSDGNAATFAPQQTFTKTGATGNATIYGFFLARAFTHDILFAQRFDDGPFAMLVDGAFLRVTPRFAVGTPIFPP